MGFQLIAVFNRPFLDLDAAHRLLHLGALVLVAIAIGLIMAPASYRRLASHLCFASLDTIVVARYRLGHGRADGGDQP